MKRVALLSVLLAAGCGGSDPPPPRAGTPAATAVASATCDHPRVHHTPYPGGDEGMSGIPWIRGKPARHGLVGLLWYWPEAWGRSRTARVFTGGVGPEGQSAKVLWAFLDPSARDRAGSELRIDGRNLDGEGTFSETFGAISYDGQEGAPSYATGLNLAEPGCWRLTLTTGELRATVDLPAVAESCAPARVRHDPARIEGTGGLTVTLGYWPEQWRGISRARVYTRGRATGGSRAKVMFAFTDLEARDRGDARLTVTGHDLSGNGSVQDSFAAIDYEGRGGVPSYAAILDLPEAGCWRLTATTGDLHGTFDIQAVD